MSRRKITEKEQQERMDLAEAQLIDQQQGQSQQGQFSNAESEETDGEAAATFLDSRGRRRARRAAKIAQTSAEPEPFSREIDIQVDPADLELQPVPTIDAEKFPFLVPRRQTPSVAKEWTPAELPPIVHPEPHPDHDSDLRLFARDLLFAQDARRIAAEATAREARLKKNALLRFYQRTAATPKWTHAHARLQRLLYNYLTIQEGLTPHGAALPPQGNAPPPPTTQLPGAPPRPDASTSHAATSKDDTALDPIDQTELIIPETPEDQQTGMDEASEDLANTSSALTPIGKGKGSAKTPRGKSSTPAQTGQDVFPPCLQQHPQSLRVFQHRPAGCPLPDQIPADEADPERFQVGQYFRFQKVWLDQKYAGKPFGQKAIAHWYGVKSGTFSHHIQKHRQEMLQSGFPAPTPLAAEPTPSTETTPQSASQQRGFPVSASGKPKNKKKAETSPKRVRKAFRWDSDDDDDFEPESKKPRRSPRVSGLSADQTELSPAPGTSNPEQSQSSAAHETSSFTEQLNELMRPDLFTEPDPGPKLPSPTFELRPTRNRQKKPKDEEDQPPDKE